MSSPTALSADAASATERSGFRPLPVAGWLGGALLGAVLLVAAWAKALDPAAFAEQIRLENLAFGLSPALVAALGIAVEVGLGLALLLNLRTRTVLFAATALVVFFLFVTGRNYWRDAHGIAPPAAGCGCFGNLVERTPAEAFWQDLFLLVPALALAWTGRPAPGATASRRLRWGATAAAAAGAAAFAQAAPGLPLDDLATRLKPGVRLESLCTGRGEARVCLGALAPELTTGTHWVVLVDPKDAGFGAVSETLNAHTLAGRQPPVTALADVTAEEQNALFWRFAPAFDLHETPAALLRPLYRTLPRSFLVEEGRVVRTENGVARELAKTSEKPS